MIFIDGYLSCTGTLLDSSQRQHLDVTLRSTEITTFGDIATTSIISMYAINPQTTVHYQTPCIDES